MDVVAGTHQEDSGVLLRGDVLVGPCQGGAGVAVPGMWTDQSLDLGYFSVVLFGCFEP